MSAELLKMRLVRPKEWVVASVELAGVCPRCSNTLVVIPLRLGDSKVVMHSCSACDTRWWQEGDDVLPLGQVLKAMKDNPPSSRRDNRRDEGEFGRRATSSI